MISAEGRRLRPSPDSNKSRATPGLVARFAGAIESFFVRLRPYLPWVHAAMCVVFVVIMVVPLLLPDPPESATPLTHFTTFANYAVWGLWFPLLFLSVIFTGRSWCGLLCPMGAASEWVNKVGLQRPIPGWLRWEGTPVISFVATTVLGQTLGVRDHAEAAAGIFGGTMAAALLIGFLYGRKKRAWCRHACPIGRVLGLYSRMGAVQFAPKVRLPGQDSYSEKGVCPTLIDLSRKSESRHCIECFRCVNPTAKGSVRMELRRPGVEIEQIRDHRANPVEAWFLFLDTGVALGAFLWLVLPQYQKWRQALGAWAIDRQWDWLLQIGSPLLVSVHPERAEVFLWLDFVMIVGFMLACMAVMTILLAATTSASARLAGRVGADGSFGQRFAELGYQYAPVAMMSLVIGLGGMLFDPIKNTPLGMPGVQALKGGLFLSGVIWSIWLADRILARQGVATARRWIPLLPSVAGSIAVGIAWWPAIFGL